MSEPFAADATLSGNLAGAPFRFRTDAVALATYARLHLATVAGAATERPGVDATLQWHEGLPPRDRPARRLADMERVDRDLYVGDGRLCWFRVYDLRDLHIEMIWNDGRLTVQGDFYFRLGNRPLSDALRRLRQWRRLDRLRARRFTTLLAYLVYYPCWWLLEQTQDYLAHAAPAWLQKNGRGQHNFLLVPASTAGKTLGDAIHAVCPDLKLVRVPGQSDLMFMREQGGLSAEELLTLLKPCRAAYENAAVAPATSPHARFDITDWLPLEP